MIRIGMHVTSETLQGWYFIYRAVYLSSIWIFEEYLG